MTMATYGKTGKEKGIEVGNGFFVGDIVTVSRRESDNIFFYCFGKRSEANITAYGKKWRVEPPLTDEIFTQNILLRNVESPSVYTITEWNRLTHTNKVDVDKLIECENKWARAQELAEKLKEQVTGKCSYCDQYENYFYKNSDAERCPLHEVCGSCQGVPDTEYSRITDTLDPLINDIKKLLASVTRDINNHRT